MSCNSKRLIISEEEKKHILCLYDLISEDTTSNPNSFTITGKNFFGEGKWKNISEKTKNNLISQITEASKFLSENKDAFSTVKITASESQVKNYDREITDKDVPLEPGELSRRRAETMYNFMLKQFQTLVTQGVINKVPIFERPFETKIGETEWKSGMSTNNPKYNEERYVTAEISLKEPAQCLVGLGIQVAYYKTPDKNYPCRGGHQCDLADFTVNVNGVALGKILLNNGSDGGDRVPPRLIITPEMAKSISESNKDKIVISLVCNTGNNCHSSTPEVIITKKDSTNKDVIVWHQCAAPMASRGDLTERVLLTLDGCGNVIEKGNMSVDNMSKGDKTILTNILTDKIVESVELDDLTKKLQSWGFRKSNVSEPKKNKECARTIVNPTSNNDFFCTQFRYDTVNIKPINETDNKPSVNPVYNTIYVGITLINKKYIIKCYFYKEKYNSFKIKNGNVFYNSFNNVNGAYKPQNILKLPLSVTAAKELGHVEETPNTQTAKR